MVSEKKWTDKQMQEFLKKNEQRWNDTIREKYILLSESKLIVAKIESRRKKEFRILFRSIQDLGKTVKKLKSQEKFLNGLLDKRERQLNNVKSNLNKIRCVLDEKVVKEDKNG